MADGRKRPSGRGLRVLVTGFSVFPGAPVNPTEALIGRLKDDHRRASDADVKYAVLDVDYASMSRQLSALAAGFSPDIAIHFGLARRARGFRLERVAKNSLSGARPDNAGRLPGGERICDGPAQWLSSLPLGDIAEALLADGLPVEFSEDAGAYLCNMVFALSRSHACDGLTPALVGFVHVPAFPEDAQEGEPSLSLDRLEAGARIVIAKTVANWHG